MAQQLKLTSCSCRGTRFDGLYLQFQGIPGCLLDSTGTCTHVVHINTYIHTNNKNPFVLQLVL